MDHFRDTPESNFAENPNICHPRAFARETRPLQCLPDINDVGCQLACMNKDFPETNNDYCDDCERRYCGMWHRH